MTGGTVHRGTGDYGDRQAIVCWLDPSANAPCTKFAWYQFYCVQVAIDMRDGKGPTGPNKKGDPYRFLSDVDRKLPQVRRMGRRRLHQNQG